MRRGIFAVQFAAIAVLVLLTGGWLRPGVELAGSVGPSSPGPAGSSRVSVVETTTVAITFWEDGFWDVQPSEGASVAPRFRSMRNVDSLYVDTDGTYFRYYDVDGASPTGCATDGEYYVKFRSASEASFNSSTAEVACLWFDFESFVPAGSKIIEAKFPIRIAYTDGPAPDSDSAVYACMDTVAADSLWLDAPTTYCGTLWEADVSWDYVSGYAAASDAWVPDLDDRSYSWDYGILGAPTHIGEDISTGAITDTVIVDVTRPVQYALTYGVPNYGFVIRVDHSSPYEYQLRMGDHSANTDLNPTLYITYTNQKYSGPWGGKEACIVFRTDDGEDANLGWAAVSEGYGQEISYAIPLQLDNTAGNLTWEQVKDLYDDGHDLVYHGGPEATEITYGLGGIETPADDDSLSMILSRTPLMDLAGLSAADSNRVSVFSQPWGAYGADAIEMMAAMGYSASITIGWGRLDTPTQVPAWFADGTIAAQQSDSPNYIGPGREMNLFCSTTAFDASWVTQNDTTKTQEDINLRLQRAVGFVMKGNMTSTFPVYGTSIWINAHEDALGEGYSTGIVTPEQLGWIEEWCQNNSTMIKRATLGEMFGIVRGRSRPIDAPAWAHSNHSEVTAADGIYWYWEVP